jgi:HAD superfamily hydrolase (TIGR01549 family)
LTLTTVVLDLGETLVDETSMWQGWADFLCVPAFTLFGVLGGLAAREEDHRGFLTTFRPDADWAEVRAAKEQVTPWTMTRRDLYPDAEACLGDLREDGWRVVVGGNQPVSFQRLVEGLELPVDLVTSSGELGADKPEKAFYEAIAARAGVRVDECVHVGDRVDNDVVGAANAGMTAVHLVRGPWGYLHADHPAVQHQVPSLIELPGLLRTLR